MSKVQRSLETIFENKEITLDILKNIINKYFGKTLICGGCPINFEPEYSATQRHLTDLYGTYSCRVVQNKSKEHRTSSLPSSVSRRTERTGEPDL